METPCTKICVLDPLRQLCSGCGRTLDEIADWAEMSDEMRRHVMAQLPMRLEKLKSD
jgi:predicted Fe-S protein YdhL (DUF1289 family)